MPSRRAKASPQPSGAAEGRTGAARPWFLLGLIAVYLLLAASYNKLVPFKTGAAAAAAIQAQRLPVNADEAAHVANAYIYKTGHLPVFRAGDSDFEAHQPPLYYALIAPFLAPQSSAAEQPAAAARWVSILMGALLLFFVWSAIYTVFPEREYLADTAACICLLPTNLNVCASISNDVLTNAIMAAALWQLARLICLANNPKTLTLKSVLLGCLMTVGIYTKTSTLVLFPAVLVAVWLLARRGIIGTRDAIKVVGLSWGVGLVLASPWLMRNTKLYGDPLAQHIFNTAFANTATTAKMLTHIPAPVYAHLVANWSFASFWGVFDGMQLFLGANLYYLLAVVALVQAIGAFRWVRRVSLAPAQSVALAAFVTAAVVTILAFVRFNMVFFQAQGRYLFPGLVFFGFVLTVGTLGWLREPTWESGGDAPAPTRAQRLLPYMTALVFLVLNAASLYTLQNAFPSVG